MSQQLTLNVGRRDGFRFSSFFVTPDNAELLGILKNGFEAHFPQIFLWGDAQVGKSHLLQAYCHHYYQRGLMAAYLPLSTCAQYGIRMLVGLETKQLVVIDDLDSIIGKRDWEEALMHVINTSRANQQPLMLAARTNPREMPCVLADFASRLLWGPVHRVHSLDEAQRIQAMRWRAHQRGFDLPDQAVNYIIKHYSHDMGTLMMLLDRLDMESLSKGRKVTRDLVRDALRTL